MSISFIASSNVRPDIKRSVLERTEGLLQYYEEKMGRGIAVKPQIILTSSHAEFASNRGDVTPNGVIFLRYRYPEDEPLSRSFEQLAMEFWRTSFSTCGRTVSRLIHKISGCMKELRNTLLYWPFPSSPPSLIGRMIVWRSVTINVRTLCFTCHIG